MSLYFSKDMVGLRVGLNYENPMDTDRVSTITFGYYDFAHVDRGENGLVGFDNVGQDNWSIMLNSLKYDGKDL